MHRWALRADAQVDMHLRANQPAMAVHVMKMQMTEGKLHANNPLQRQNLHVLYGIYLETGIVGPAGRARQARTVANAYWQKWLQTGEVLPKCA